MSTATINDPQLAWVTASRDGELERWRQMYAALHPSPTDRAADRTPIAADRCATTTKNASTS